MRRTGPGACSACSFFKQPCPPCTQPPPCLQATARPLCTLECLVCAYIGCDMTSLQACCIQQSGRVQAVPSRASSRLGEPLLPPHPTYPPTRSLGCAWSVPLPVCVLHRRTGCSHETFHNGSSLQGSAGRWRLGQGQLAAAATVPATAHIQLALLLALLMLAAAAQELLAAAYNTMQGCQVTVLCADA